MGSAVSEELRHMTGVVRRARNVFLMAVGVCVILTLNLAFFRGHSTGGLAGLRACYGPLLLWGLTAALYAFHTLARAASGLTETVDSIRASERMKGLRRLAIIKQRLRRPGSQRTE